MAGIDWALAKTDPNAQQRGYSYAQQIAQAAGQQRAGQAYAAGDYAGASKALAENGDIEGAMKLQQAQAAQAQQQQTVQQQAADRDQKAAAAVHDYVAKALPIFQHVLQVHAGDPDGGTAAVAKAFDSVAPEISQITGHNDAAIAQLRQNLIADPKGTLDRIQAMLPQKVQSVAPGSTLVSQQGDTVTPIYSAPAKPVAPTVHTFTEGDKTVDKQFNTQTGQWEVLSSGPRYKPAAAGGGVGSDEPLNDDALGHQVGMYISSRGNIIPQFGMGKAGSSARSRFYNALGKAMDAGNITDADIASGKAEYKANASALTNVTKQIASVGGYEATVQKNIGILESLLGKGAPQGQAPVINRWIQAGRRGLQGDADVSAYDTAIKTVTAEYAKVMSGGTGSSAASSDSARAEAESLLNGAQTVEQVRRVLGVMRREMANRISSLHEQASSLKGSLGNTPQAAAAPDGAPAFRYDAKGNRIPG